MIAGVSERGSRALSSLSSTLALWQDSGSRVFCPIPCHALDSSGPDAALKFHPSSYISGMRYGKNKFGIVLFLTQLLFMSWRS